MSVANARAAFVAAMHAELDAAFRAHRAQRPSGERALRDEDGWHHDRRVRGAARGEPRARPRDAVRRTSGRIATISRSSSMAAMQAVRLAGPAARDHPRVEDRGARDARARARRFSDPACSTTCQRSSIRRATNTCSSTSRIWPRSASSRPRTQSTSCCVATGRITASKMARFPREIRHMIPFVQSLRMCYPV